MRKLILLTFFVFLFTNCSKDHMFDCLKSTGDEIMQIRRAGNFTNLNLKDNVDIILYSDTTSFIRVTAGEHLIEGIITEIENGTLYIRNENRCNWTRSFSNKYIVEIGMRDPVKIETYGSGNVTCADTIRTEEFFFDSWNASGSYNFLFNSNKIHINNNIGRADYHAKGKANVTFVYMNDVATLDFSELRTELFYIRSSTTGDCKINVDKELDVVLLYTGDIYYTGSLYKLSQDITGTGRLISY
jgi:hypothetical protein